MSNVLRVLARDVGRIARTPKSWAILLGLIIVPALYAWVNIIAFWDPYGDTAAVNVVVVNQDTGAKSKLTGPINVGDQIVAQLEQNDQLGWQFMDREAAMTAVQSGDSYAAIVIPPDFSRHLLTITTPDFKAPVLQYFTNEKANAIAPKITSAGATALDTQVNSTFVSTVADKVTQNLRQAGFDIEGQFTKAQNKTIKRIDRAEGRVQSARSGLAGVNLALQDTRAALGDVKRSLRDTNRTIRQVQRSLAQVESLIEQAQRQLGRITRPLTSAYTEGSALLSRASSKIDAGVTKLVTGVERANASLDAAIEVTSDAVAANGRVLTELQDLLQTLDPDDPAYEQLSDTIEKLQARNKADRQLLATLKDLNSEVTSIGATVEAAARELEASVRETTAAGNRIRAVLTEDLPGLNRSLSAMAAGVGGFSTALNSQRQLVTQSVKLLNGLDKQLRVAGQATLSLDANLGEISQDLVNLRTDVTALSTADALNQVKKLTKLDPEQVAHFMASPVQVTQHPIYPVASYGSSMAPLFTNLSLWIGAFALVVLLKQEVDTQGVRRLTVRQAYLGRWLLLAMFSVCQALLVSIGNAVIGVQMVNTAIFAATAVFIGLVYLSIIYALAVSFGYVGKGFIILLVVIQIPGASGIYPIQMMPEFFQALYPLFPFNYAIDALRETIGGFYDGYYWRVLAVLAGFAALGFILGLFLRQRLGPISRLFNRELDATGLFVAEDVQVLGSRHRLSQLVQVLANRSRFRDRTARRKEWLERHHLSLRAVPIVAGLVLTVVLLVLGTVFPDAKATVLGLWGLVCLLVIAALVAQEYLAQNVMFAEEHAGLSERELLAAIVREEESARYAAPSGEEEPDEERAAPVP